MSANVEVTNVFNGPFVIIVTDLEQPEDPDYPMVVAPPGGFPNKEEALRYIETYAKRKVPYLGLKFRVTPLCTLESFHVFCSWED